MASLVRFVRLGWAYQAGSREMSCSGCGCIAGISPRSYRNGSWSPLLHRKGIAHTVGTCPARSFVSASYSWF